MSIDQAAVELGEAQQELLRRRLAKARQSATGTTRPSRIPRRTRPAQLSFAQERVWFMEQLAPGTAAYHSAQVLSFPAASLDVPALRRALRWLLTRHDALRMSFPPTPDGKPVAVIADPQDSCFDGLLAESVAPGDDAALARADEVAARPFDLGSAPLLHAELITVPGGSTAYLVLALHHIVTDGWSNDVLTDQLATRYAAEQAGGLDSDPPNPVQYSDFAEFQRGELATPGMQRRVQEWAEHLTGTPVLHLPTDRQRPAEQTFSGAEQRFSLTPAQYRDVTELGRRHGCTPFMVLLCAYQLTLSCFSSQREFAIGSPVAGRSYPDLDDVVGMFVNMMPLRADLTGDPTVGELLARARTEVLQGLDREDVPFEQVVQQLNLPRDPSRSPLFQAMFVLQNYARFDGHGAVSRRAVGWQPVDVPATRFDIELHAHDVPGGGLGCRIVANPDLFDDSTIGQIIQTFLAVVEQLPRAANRPISELGWLGQEQRRLLADFNDTATSFAEQPDTLTALVDRGLAAHGDARVIADSGRADGARSCSFAELDSAAERVRRRLSDAGIGPGAVVAVGIERSLELVAALVGILRSGAAYLPLDPEYPADRLRFMLDDSQAVALLCVGADGAIGQLGSTAEAGDRVTVMDLAAIFDTDAPDLRPAWQLPPVPIRPDDAAYLIYTSGSTGKPKGVVNEHHGIVNRLLWMQQRFGLDGHDVVLQKTPASFDVSVWEFFWPLMSGAALVLAEPGGHRDPGYLSDVLRRRGVSVGHFVPSMLDIFLGDLAARPDDRPPALRAVVCSGEELRPDTADKAARLLPDVELHNLYGPTEAAVDVTAWRYQPELVAGIGRVPIGGPVANTTIRLVDDAGNEVPAGAFGELLIGGTQVARGYLNRDELTAERFRRGPDDGQGHHLWYATGDQARWRADGTLEFHGRLDGQVKLRGLRIELGEIEHVLAAQPGVAAAAAAVKEVAEGDPRLVGYTVAADAAAEVDPAALRSALGAQLPNYMVPGHFVNLPELPLSPNGKLDRARLPLPELAGAATAYVAPATALQQQIADIWAEVLGVEQVGAGDDFFAIGGHSLLATQVVAKLRPVAEAHGVQVGVMDIFQHPTVEKLAALFDGDAPSERGLLYQLTRGRSAAPTELSLVCVPYGGGSAAVYQPLADQLPESHALWAVAIPGHDVGLDEQGLPFDELAQRCTDEVMEKVSGPVVLYGHCGVGGALIIEVARRLEAAGRELEAVYVGGIFPFARARGRFARITHWFAERASNRSHSNWLKSMGVDLEDLDQAQVDRIITNMRRDSDHAEEHFTQLLDSDPPRLRAPIISVVGERDPVTEFYQERFREWEFLADRTALVVLPEAGHFFLKYRAAELVDIVTSVHTQLAAQQPDAFGDSDAWWVEAVGERGSGTRVVSDRGAATLVHAGKNDRDAARGRNSRGPDDAAGVVEPSMRRFLLIAIGQLTSTIGSQLTGWALPIWILQRTGSLGLFGITSIVAFLPVILASPLAGVWADRFDRRKVILTASCISAVAELLVAGFVLAETDSVIALYVLVFVLSCAGTVQRLTFTAAVPQIVPKRFLGHANGVIGIINGAGQLFIPLVAAGLLGLIGLRGILVIDLVSYVLAIAVLLVVKFPASMGRRRRETFSEQLLGGLRLTWGNRYFRAMLIFFGLGNLLYAPALLFTAPLVLGMGGDLGDVGRVAVVEAIGALTGGAIMGLWGGPGRRRMVVNILFIALAGVMVMVAGSRPSIVIVMIGLFGTACALGIANGIYLTTVQIKVPQRFHGRVFAVNQTIAWSTFPLGFAVTPWLVDHVFQPAVDPGGALAGSVGQLVGTGDGRGIGLAYVVCGLGMLLNAVVALMIPRLRELDSRLPDSDPDDLIGVAELKASSDQNSTQDRRAVRGSPSGGRHRREPERPALVSAGKDST